MRLRILGLLFATLALASPAFAADPPQPVKKWINLPSRIVTTPAAPADAPIVLEPGKMYVYDTEVAAINLISPGGLISVTKLSGPCPVYGYFADNLSGEPELKTFAGKFVYVVTIVKGKTGSADLFAIPVGVKDESEIVKVSFASGSTPVPPPIEKTQFVKDLTAAYKDDASATKAADLANLIEVYKFARDTSTKSSTTWGNMFDLMAGKATEVKVGGKIMGVQMVIQKQLQSSLPWQGKSKTALTDADREKARIEFDGIAKSLSEVK